MISLTRGRHVTYLFRVMKEEEQRVHRNMISAAMQAWSSAARATEQQLYRKQYQKQRKE